MVYFLLLFVCFFVLRAFIPFQRAFLRVPYGVNIALFFKLSKYFFPFSLFSVILYNFCGFILLKVAIVVTCFYVL